MRDGSGQAWEKRWVAVLLAVVVVLGFAYRSVNATRIFDGERIHFRGGDAQYHMRRAALAVRTRLAVPEYDAYMNYPHGLHCNWPPLFDQCIAGVSLVAGGGEPSTRTIETVGAVLPPILGALCLLVVYFIARIYMARHFALLAALALCLLPYHVQVSVMGRPDHHIAVVLLSSCLFLSVRRLEDEYHTWAIVLYGLLSALLLVLCLATWVGSLLFVVILFAYYAIRLFMLAKRTGQLTVTYIRGAGLFLAAGFILWPLASQTHWGASGIARWDALSVFHPRLLVSCGATLFLLGPSLRTLADAGKRRSPLHLVALALAPITVAMLAFWTAPSNLAALITGGPQYVLKRDPFMQYVVESHRPTWGTGLENFSLLLPLFPVILALLIVRGARRQRLRPALLFTAWTGVLALVTLSQERFSDLLSVPAAVLIAFALEQCYLFLKRHRAGKPDTPAASVIIVCALFSIVMLLPIRWGYGYVRNARHYLPAGITHLCDWIREHTPPTRGYHHADQRPEYSILAEWPYGNVLTYLAHRPNVANGFVGWAENRESNLVPYRFFTTTNTHDAARLLVDNGVRYILVSEPLQSGQLARAIDILGLDQNDYFVETQPGNKEYRPTVVTENTMAYRLFVYNGAGLSGFTLVYESPDKILIQGRQFSMMKLFEFRTPEP